MWFIGVEVEQETSAPAPKKNPGSAPVQNAKKLQHLVALSTFSELRRIHTRGFVPRACSRGTLREQSSSVCTNDFIGILYPREQNFHPAKCSTIFNRLNIWEQAPGANRANLKTLPRMY